MRLVLVEMSLIKMNRMVNESNKPFVRCISGLGFLTKEFCGG